MSQANTSLTTTVRIRVPRELLIVFDDWATINQLPRSIAFRRLMLRGLAMWEGNMYIEEAEEAAICNCSGGPDTCTGDCR